MAAPVDAERYLDRTWLLPRLCGIDARPAGVRISEGTVHNVHQAAARQAGAINRGIDLSPIRVGLHDEIFQGPQPVLAGVDARSTYCYLPAAAEHRGADT